MSSITKKPSSKKFKKGVVFEAKKTKEKSPSISRSFTDKSERGSPKGAARSFTEKKDLISPQVSVHKKSGLKKLRAYILNKYFLVSFITTFLGVALTLQGISVQKSLTQLQDIKGERAKIEKEITYWESITKDHPGYRDAYFKLALLEYQLGNREKAKTYVEKTLEIDPNYTPAREFRKEVGIPYSL